MGFNIGLEKNEIKEKNNDYLSLIIRITLVMVIIYFSLHILFLIVSSMDAIVEICKWHNTAIEKMIYFFEIIRPIFIHLRIIAIVLFGIVVWEMEKKKEISKSSYKKAAIIVFCGFIFDILVRLMIFLRVKNFSEAIFTENLQYANSLNLAINYLIWIQITFTIICLDLRKKEKIENKKPTLLILVVINNVLVALMIIAFCVSIITKIALLVYFLLQPIYGAIAIAGSVEFYKQYKSITSCAKEEERKEIDETNWKRNFDRKKGRARQFGEFETASWLLVGSGIIALVFSALFFVYPNGKVSAIFFNNLKSLFGELQAVLVYLSIAIIVKELYKLRKKTIDEREKIIIGYSIGLLLAGIIIQFGFVVLESIFMGIESIETELGFLRTLYYTLEMIIPSGELIIVCGIFVLGIFKRYLKVKKDYKTNILIMPIIYFLGYLTEKIIIISSLFWIIHIGAIGDITIITLSKALFFAVSIELLIRIKQLGKEMHKEEGRKVDKGIT